VTEHQHQHQLLLGGGGSHIASSRSLTAAAACSQISSPKSVTTTEKDHRQADDRVLPLADELRKVQLERLGEMRQAALVVLERFHLVVSHGHVIEHNGAPIEYDAPVLAAIDRLLRIEERIAKLCGLDAPLESNVNATIASPSPEVLAMIEQARAAQELVESELTEASSAATE
jgi:hypothetical protein